MPLPPFGRPRQFAAVALALLFAGLLAAAEPESELKLVVIVSRHGVRAPLDAQQDFNKFSAQPFPKWDELPGHLTAHGEKQMELMGAYYRARYVQAGLLTGQPAADAPLIFFRANNPHRTVASARALGAGLLPGVSPEIHARPENEIDPLFRPVAAKIGEPDRARAMAAALGRAGGDVRAVELTHRPEFETLERVLVGENGQVPAGKTAVLDLPTEMTPGQESIPTLRGPLATAFLLTDLFMLQYANGLPLAKVGWGRLTPERFTQLLELHSLEMNLTVGALYPAQIEASNIASHLADTLTQAASGRTQAGAFGPPGQKLVVLAGHDSTIVCLGALLGLEWRLPGTQRNPVLLGGALVFELRERKNDHQFFVRAVYISPSLDQTRALAPLTLENPPGLAPIFIPDCSEATPGFDAPFAKFDEHLRRAIDPKFVTPSAL